jgi:hypothetical protein
MSGWLIIATGLIYMWVAIEQLYYGNWPLSGVYAGYAFSNIFLYFLAVKGSIT